MWAVRGCCSPPCVLDALAMMINRSDSSGDRVRSFFRVFETAHNLYLHLCLPTPTKHLDSGAEADHPEV